MLRGGGPGRLGSGAGELGMERRCRFPTGLGRGEGQRGNLPCWAARRAAAMLRQQRGEGGRGQPGAPRFTAAAGLGDRVRGESLRPS